jgi:hypothetical protein
MEATRPHQRIPCSKGEEGYVVPSGLGVRRGDESAVGTGRRRRSQAMWCGEGDSVEVRRWEDVAHLIAKGRAPFGRAHPYCLLD